MVTALEAYQHLAHALRDSGVEEYELEATELAAKAYGLNRRMRGAWRTQTLTPEQEKLGHALLARRLAGEPIAYVLGEWDFYGLTFRVTPDVLIPRGDTEWLCDEAVAQAKRFDRPHVLDLCCGSGCIGIALAVHVPQALVTAADVSEQALAITRENAARHALTAPRFCAVHADALGTDTIPGSFDVIVSNPPYITAQEMAELDNSVADFEPHLALFGGTDGLDFYRALAQQQPAKLAPDGQLLVECGWKQAHDVARIFSHAGLVNIDIRKDLAGTARIVCASRRPDCE